jgi:hypothetical protein
MITRGRSLENDQLMDEDLADLAQLTRNMSVTPAEPQTQRKSRHHATTAAPTPSTPLRSRPGPSRLAHHPESPRTHQETPRTPRDRRQPTETVPAVPTASTTSRSSPSRFARSPKSSRTCQDPNTTPQPSRNNDNPTVSAIATPSMPGYSRPGPSRFARPPETSRSQPNDLSQRPAQTRLPKAVAVQSEDSDDDFPPCVAPISDAGIEGSSGSSNANRGEEIEFLQSHHLCSLRIILTTLYKLLRVSLVHFLCSISTVATLMAISLKVSLYRHPYLRLNRSLLLVAVLTSLWIASVTTPASFSLSITHACSHPRWISSFASWGHPFLCKRADGSGVLSTFLLVATHACGTTSALESLAVGYFYIVYVLLSQFVYSIWVNESCDVVYCSVCDT